MILCGRHKFLTFLFWLQLPTNGDTKVVTGDDIKLNFLDPLTPLSVFDYHQILASSDG